MPQERELNRGSQREHRQTEPWYTKESGSRGVQKCKLLLATGGEKGWLEIDENKIIGRVSGVSTQGSESLKIKDGRCSY